MKYLIIALFFFTISDTTAQTDWVISGRKVYLPSMYADVECYYSKKNLIRHYHKRLPAKHLKGKKLKDSSSVNALKFVQDNMRDTTYLLPLNTIHQDSIDLDFLMDNNMIIDSMILINYSLYSRQFYKVVYDSCETCDFNLPIIPLRGRQIDGERLIVNISIDTNEVLKLNIGTTELSNPREFKVWILISMLYHKFNLFNELNLDEYFSKEDMTIEIQEYIKALKK